MLNEHEFSEWCLTMGLEENTRKVISRIRESGPSRRVQGRPFNSHGRYPSHKMGFTVQWESGSVERLAVWLYEHDDDVLEYYDQPEQIKLNYTGKNGKNRGVLHTPDFFVLRSHSAGWEEWKTEENLIALSEKEPFRYTKVDGHWVCPPGQTYASQFGLHYYLRSSVEIDPTYVGNIHFLSDYIQHPIPMDSEKIEELKQLLYQQPGMSLTNLIQSPIGIDADTVFMAIATEQIYVDLFKEAFREQEFVQVFPNREIAEAFDISSSGRSITQDDHQIILNSGEKFTWDGTTWEIVNVGFTQISIKDDDENIQILSISGFESIVKQGVIQGVPTVKSNSTLSELALEARKEDLKIALERYKVIKPFLEGQQKPSSATRNVRRWITKYNFSLECTGYGLDGLLPQNRQKGNRGPKLPELTIKKMIEFIGKHYETYDQPTIYDSFILFQKECNNEGLLCPSYPTYARYVHERPKYIQEKERKGHKAARKYKILHWHLEFLTPRHGDRPFEIAHIDHTELDVEVRLGDTDKSARPWLTLMIDAFTRRVLAFDIDFEKPGSRSIMRVVRKCIQRFQRMPETFVVDGGKEFESIYFETLAARMGTEIQSRRSKPTNGSVVERIFGTTNKTVLYALIANTQSTKNVRQLTPKTNPKNRAVWNLQALDELLQNWFYETYDQRDHPALGMSPRNMFSTGLSQTGHRPQRIVPYDREFWILTCPPTKRQGKSKVQVGRGVKIDNLYYWAEDFSDGRVEGTVIPTRVDPDNVGIAYAYVLGRWVELHSEQYWILRGRSRKQVEIATKILKEQYKQTQKMRQTINSHQIAHLLSEAHDKELQLQIEIDEARKKKSSQIVQDRFMKEVTSVTPQSKDTNQSSTSSSKSSHPLEEFGDLEDLL
ncbi:TnsA endonuclease N-terminal domain-containing protein [Alicyclobacillus mengziensis]|uniref:DDE-type integrase/transposase/recombinase n=1 Tax=Alicyclobacillus mengziensis TaxID=2931921 RepID=A0A9X7W0X3_9BACL|nr:DDE-type integrase/transposase/recombinase [Alicyclobacillus mengziensis]QSO48594.1 DDE-type integrase/transposase/recombinase [Alicyclobacillus mengziensis]